MNRRSFFRFLGAGAATLALSEAIPFGRVWSFPSKIVVPETRLLTLEEIRESYLAPAAKELANSIDLAFYEDFTFISGQRWPSPQMLRETTITLKRTAGFDLELLPA